MPNRLDFIQPEKARLFRPVKDDRLLTDSRWTAELKHDGFRIHAIRQPDGPELYSSLGNRLYVPWLEEAMVDLPALTYLDGELKPDNEAGMSNDVAHLLVEDPDRLQLVVFDCLYMGGSDLRGLPLRQRREMFPWAWLRNTSVSISANAYVVLATDKESLWNDVVSMGREGIVYKDTLATYAPGSRKNWIKRKQEDDFDCVIVSADNPPTHWTVEPGKYGTDGKLYPEGKESSTWAKYLRGEYVGLCYGWYLGGYDAPKGLEVIDVPHVGRCVKSGTVGKFGHPAEMQKFVGQVVVIKGKHLYKETGAIQHPVYKRTRDDKRAMSCWFPPYEVDEAHENSALDRQLKTGRCSECGRPVMECVCE